MYTKEEIIARREARKKERMEKKEQENIAAMKAQKPVKELTITIEWKKSRTWGANPLATALVTHKDGTTSNIGTFTCSGCGYDKESTVIADVFNSALRYELFRKHDGEAPYGMYYYNGATKKTEYKDKDGNVDVYTNIPRYNGGVGTSCYYTIAKFIGGKFERIASGNSFDVFKFSRA